MTSAAPPRPLGLRALVVWCAIGLLLGGALGFALGNSRPRTAHAEAIIAILPEASVANAALGQPDGQDATAFIQSELIVLNGRQLGAAVGKNLKLVGPPNVNASQFGLTYDVRVNATANSDAAATAVLTNLVSSYAAQRRGALTADIDRASETVGAQIDSVRQSLASSSLAGPRTATGPTTTIAALQEEYGRLLAVNSALAGARGQLARAVTVVQPAAAVSAGLGAGTTYGVAGALLGVLAALAVLLLVRRSSTRILDVGELTDLGVPVLLPTLPPDRGGSIATAVNAAQREAQLLSARLVAGDEEHPALVLFGATDGAATGFTAVALAARLAERGPVLLLLTADLYGARTGARLGLSPEASGLSDLRPQDLSGAALLEFSENTFAPDLLAVGAGQRGRQGSTLDVLVRAGLLDAALDSGATVVIDAPPLEASSATVELARQAGGAVLVVARDRARDRDVLTTRDILAAQDVPLTGALVTHSHRRVSWRRLLPRGSGAAETATNEARPAMRPASGRGTAPQPAEQLASPPQPSKTSQPQETPVPTVDRPETAPPPGGGGMTPPQSTRLGTTLPPVAPRAITSGHHAAPERPVTSPEPSSPASSVAGADEQPGAAVEPENDVRSNARRTKQGQIVETRR